MFACIGWMATAGDAMIFNFFVSGVLGNTHRESSTGQRRKKIKLEEGIRIQST